MAENPFFKGPRRRRARPSIEEALLGEDERRHARLRRTAFALGAAAFVLAFFHRLAPGAIAADLRDAYGASGTALGFVAALYFYPYAAMQLPSGVLADTIGPRKLFTIGSVVAGAGSILFGVAPGVATLLLGRALVGFGVAVAFISVLKVIASWFREREFGTYTGLLMFIGNLGGMLAAWPLAWLTQQVSWRHVFVAAGAVSLGLAAAIWRWVRDDPRAAGLRGAHVPEGGSAPDTAAATADRPHWREGISKVARNRWTWVCFAAQCGVVASFLSFSGLWAIPYLSQGLGMSRDLATTHATLMILGFALGALVAGTASDRMGRRVPLMRSMLTVYAACWLPWVAGWSLPSALSLAVFFLLGLGMGGISLTWACSKELNPPALAGTATSLVNTAGFLGTALLQPLVGWVLDRSGGDYRQAVIVLGAVALAGVAAVYRIPETRCRNVYADFAR